MAQDRETDARRPTLVYFASRRSGPCRRVQGFVDQVLQARQNHETFRRRTVDVEEQPELARRFRVREVPTIIVVDEGRVARRVEGRVGIAQIRAALADWLN
jgi:thioredoxin-like negative regulator of GroEL